MNRLADPIQCDPMSGGQRLDAADSRNDLVFKCHGSSGNDPIDDPQRAIVETRIAPHEKGAALLLAEFLANQPLIYGGPLLVPCFNSRLIRRRGSIALWIVDFDHPVRLALDVALADVLAQADQILFLTSLIHHEEDIDLVERIDRLHRDVVGIAGTDADDKDLSHLQASSAIHTRPQVFESYPNQG